jgi:hypothetical protein
VLSTSAAYRLRMLLAVLTGTVVVCLVVLAVVLVIGAMAAGSPPDAGADWGAVY